MIYLSFIDLQTLCPILVAKGSLFLVNVLNPIIYNNRQNLIKTVFAYSELRNFLVKLNARQIIHTAGAFINFRTMKQQSVF